MLKILILECVYCNTQLCSADEYGSNAMADDSQHTES
jgi:hypothetical protein